MTKKIKLKNILNENTPGFENRKFGDSLPTLDSVQKAYEAKKHLQPVNEGKDVVRKLVAELNNELIEQPWVKTDSRTLQKVLTKVLKKAVKQKIIDEGCEESPIEEGDNTQYSWGQINKALMKYGMSPKNILRFISTLKKM